LRLIGAELRLADHEGRIAQPKIEPWRLQVSVIAGARPGRVAIEDGQQECRFCANIDFTRRAGVDSG